ncbi:MAG: hypothetical protein AB7S48_13220 [Bacteroidales bacterium]
MKKFIYIAGIVSANLMLFGALLKALHLPGAAIILMLSVFVFCFVFLPMALYNNYTNQEEKKSVWLYIVTFIVFFVCILGALFKILHWPGAGIFLVFGILSPFVLFLPVYLYNTRKTKNKSVANNLAVMFGLTFLAVFNVFLSLSVSSDVLKDIAIVGFNNEISKNYIQNLKSSNESCKIQLKAQEISNYIEELKHRVIVEALKGKEYNQDGFSALDFPDKAAAVSSIFISENDNTSDVENLKLQIDDLYKIILDSKNTSNDVRELTKSLFNIDAQPQIWYGDEFPSNQVVFVYDALCRIQSNVLFVGSECSN